MIGVIFFSNATLEVWLRPWLSLATFIYPLSYWITTRAVLLHGKGFATRVVAAGFVGAMVISVHEGLGQVGLASLVAYGASQALDLSFLVRFRRRKGIFWPLMASWSAVTLDSILFFTGAFWGKELDWLPVALTDYGVKLGLDAVWFCILRKSLVDPARR
jgi:uncharacterized PurR-regulated membrane protein YhhQ (DUF165 family)